MTIETEKTDWEKITKVCVLNVFLMIIAFNVGYDEALKQMAHEVCDTLYKAGDQLSSPKSPGFCHGR